jgi:hypothetical protein
MATDLSNWAPFEILAGPADVYVGSFEATFPAVGETPKEEDFTYIGQTEGGVTVRHTQTITPLSSDQHTGNVKAVRTEEGLEIEFSIVELTLENYSIALNSSTVKSESGTESKNPDRKQLAFHQGIHVDLRTLLVRGRSPYGNYPAQYQVPVAYQSESPEVSFVKDDKSVLHCVWNALEDLEAESGEEFGLLIAATNTT